MPIGYIINSQIYHYAMFLIMLKIALNQCWGLQFCEFVDSIECKSSETDWSDFVSGKQLKIPHLICTSCMFISLLLLFYTTDRCWTTWRHPSGHRTEEPSLQPIGVRHAAPNTYRPCHWTFSQFPQWIIRTQAFGEWNHWVSAACIVRSIILLLQFTSFRVLSYLKGGCDGFWDERWRGLKFQTQEDCGDNG